MFTQDPFQSYQTPGAFSTGGVPYGLPYTASQSPFHPMAFAGHPLSNPAMGGYGIHPQQLQSGIGGQQGLLPQQLLALNPLAAGLQNPFLQQVVAQNLWQNPLLAAGLQNPLLHPMLAYQGWQQQQPQFNYPLAPQTMIGAGGIGQAFAPGNPLASQNIPGGGLGQHQFSQIHPLAQLAMRQATGYGMSPLAGGF